MTGPNVSLSPLPGWRRHSRAQDRGQNLFRRRERAPEGVTGRPQGITPAGRARKHRACVSSVQTAHKTRANFTAEQARQPGRLGTWALAPAGAWLPCSPPPGRGSSEQSTQDRMPPFMRDFFPTGKFKNARIAPHNRRPKMAINKRRFSREATYARRCLRGRSYVRGRVVPCPVPQPGKVSGMGMQDRRPPRMRKKFPHQDSTLPPSLCPIRTPGPYPQQAPETTRETTGASAAGPVLPALPPARRPQRAPEAARETAGASAAGPVLSALPPARRPQQAPGAARETAGTSAAGPVTFNARRDYELLEQVVSTYGR